MMKSSYEEERAFQAHEAANDLLSNLNRQHSGGSTNISYPYTSGEYNDTDYLITPKKSPVSTVDTEGYLYIPGTAGNYITDSVLPQRRTSARRLFSICCVFDLLFVSIVWIITAINTYGGLIDAFHECVLHFKYKTSMADLMLLSFARSTVLLMHYWVIVSKIQITVILTTSISTIYVFVKLILFDRSTHNTFETYALLLISFLLSWVEVWLFETKVLKAENQVTRILRPTLHENHPILQRSYNTIGSEYNYSAFMTPSGSAPVTPRGRGDKQPQIEIERLDPRGQLLYNVATQAQIELHETVLWPDGWTTESEKDGVKVYSRAQRKAPNRLFLSESHYLCSLEDLFEVLYTQIDHITDWNKSIIHIECPERLTAHLDILYTVGTSGGAGLIKSRDFLTLRYWLKERDTYFIVSRDISDPVKPASDKYPRGFNGPCGFVFFPALDGSVKLTYVVNVDLKLPLVPQKVINSNLVSVVHEFHLSLRSRIDDYLETKRRSTRGTMDD